jgi:2-oxoisovalerate dehydrogenase E1 component
VDSVPTCQSEHVSGAAVPSVTLSGTDVPKALTFFRFMVLGRTVDRVEMELVNRGEAFFHVGGAGHEAVVALADHLRSDDFLHPHYRDKALMMARGLPADEFFHALLGSAASASAGRQMCAHISAPELNLLTMAGPVGNSALQAVGVAHELVARRQRTTGSPGAGASDASAGSLPIVVVANGDSTTQEGEFLEAIAEAVRARLPVLFLVEDNGYGISTRTAGQTFYSLPSGPASEFYGLPVHRLDGREVLACHAAFGRIVAAVRQGQPAVVVVEMERLTHHTNADDERTYRDEQEIRQVRSAADPIERLRARLIGAGVSPGQLAELESEVEREVRAASERALVAPNPEANLDARPPAATSPRLPSAPPGGISAAPSAERGPLTMLEVMREVLRRHLADDPAVSLYGEDIEDPKGDVFGLTRGLTRAFPGQVRNSALTESTILGVSIGRGMAGGRPVAFIQFADFLPLAFNQIACELGTVYWRSQGGWRSPVIVLAPCGGYRPGLGPFHSQTFESVLAHMPGIDVVMPSTAADAAGLLNAAFANQHTGRPTIFLYPKVCLNDPVQGAPASALDTLIQPGEARFVCRGGELTLVAWGSTVGICSRAAQALQAAGVGVDLIDLRSLTPWDRRAVSDSVRRSGRLIVVHEDNLTCGFGAEIVAAVAEDLEIPFKARRVTRPDTYPPFNYINQAEVLPGLRPVLEAAAALLELDLRWEGDAPAAKGTFVLEAVGSSPADQTVSVVEWRVRDGDTIAAGDLIADCEADKATFELRAPVAGVIGNLLPVDEKVPVGSPLARILIGEGGGAALPRRVPLELRPVLSRRAGAPANPVFVPAHAVGRRVVVGLSTVTAVPAGRIVTNEELIRRFPGRTALDIYQRTGIESRRMLAPGETALSLAARAARAALEEVGLRLADIDAIFVSTSTPVSISPSMACLLHHELSRDGGGRDIAASDILAACTGYLYALQAAFDYCRSKPDANLLVVSAEAMSEYTDMDRLRHGHRVWRRRDGDGDAWSVGLAVWPVTCASAPAGAECAG